MSFTYDIQAKVAINRLYLSLRGSMSDDEAKEVADRVIQEIRKLRPGFTIINDISELKPASPAATEHLRRAQEASVRQGCGRVIRVVGSQAITQMQWSRTLKAAHHGGAETASTVEEAERMLAQTK
jgi:hypothetical protein